MISQIFWTFTRTFRVLRCFQQYLWRRIGLRKNREKC